MLNDKSVKENCISNKFNTDILNDSNKQLNGNHINYNNYHNNAIEKPSENGMDIDDIITEDHKENTNTINLTNNTNLNLTNISCNSTPKSQFFWNSHINNNRTIIADLFHGQLKSSTKCPKCNDINFNYEPFNVLGLSIPEELKFYIYFIPHNIKIEPYAAYKIFLKVNGNIQIKHLVYQIYEITKYKLNYGIFYSVLNNSLDKIYDSETRVNELVKGNNHLFVIESISNYCSSPQHTINKLDISTKSLGHNLKSITLVLNFLNPEEKNRKKSFTYPRLFNCSMKDNLEDIMKVFNIYIGNLVTLSNSNSNDSSSSSNNVNQNLNKIKIINTRIGESRFFFSILSLKSSKDSYQCVFCNSKEPGEFECFCINSIINNEDVNQNNRTPLFNIIENFYQTNDLNEENKENLIINFQVNLQPNSHEYKNLNSCLDLSSKNPKYKRDMGLYDLIDFFTAEEKLHVQEKYFCSKCKMNVKAIKKMDISKLPSILIINLKRFKYDIMKMKRRMNIDNTYTLTQENVTEKNESLINFPEELNLERYCNAKDTNYELYAICYHTGKISSGHYTAICKIVGKKWIKFDDRIVSNYNDNIVNSNAYILFYRNKNLN